MPRVAIAGAFHESNTFVDRRTSITDFDIATLRGEALLASLAATQTVMGGFIQGGIRHGFQLVPTIHRWATPSGIVESAAFEAIERELRESLTAALPLDGVLLELHGAMVVENLGAADGRLAQSVREAVGRIPLVAVIDPHANIPGPLLDSADVVLAYQTNPHQDMMACGERATAILVDLLSGSLVPDLAIQRVPITAAAIAQATADEPLRSILARAGEIEKQGRIRAASIIFGFAYADVPEQGMAVVTLADRNAAAARAAAIELAQLTWDKREVFARNLASPDEAVRIATQASGFTVLADVGDNVGGGAAGDSTILLGSVLAAGLPAAATMWDPAAVKVAGKAGEGATITLTVGKPPLRLEAYVRSLRDGRYVNRGPLSAGVTFDMGDVAVLESGRLTLVVQSRAVMANDQNMLAGMGVDLDRVSAVVLKGAAAVRAGWSSRAARFVDVDTPGPTTADIRSLNPRHVKRPLWPHDEFNWRAEAQ